MPANTETLIDMRQRVAVAGWSGAMPRDLALDLVRMIEGHLGARSRRTHRDDHIRAAAACMTGRIWTVAGSVHAEMLLQLRLPSRVVAGPAAQHVAAALKIDRRLLTRKQIGRILRVGHPVAPVSKKRG